MAPTRSAAISGSGGTAPRTRHAPFKKGLAFLGEFFRSPFQIGALHESPPRVARAIAADLGLERASNVVEFGPGTGPVTREILAQIPEGCRFFAIEKNPRLVKIFRERNPGVEVVEGSVEDVRGLCAARGMRDLDAVVSSIPWILLPRTLQERAVDETVATLRAGGRFSMITYRHERLGIVKRFVDLLRERFSVVEPMHPVKSRFGLAYVYRATK
jgi:phosphatidylethanolamine/phosphatidyl-N-methylethanolamine N-methyltransferase